MHAQGSEFSREGVPCVETASGGDEPQAEAVHGVQDHGAGTACAHAQMGAECTSHGTPVRTQHSMDSGRLAADLSLCLEGQVWAREGLTAEAT